MQLALSFNDAGKLRAAGFIEWEIKQYSEGKTPDGKSQPAVELNSSLWRRVLKSRRAWVDKRITEKGWSQDEVDDTIMNYYSRAGERNPWAFLKIEYISPTRRNYYEALRARTKRKVESAMGEY